MNETPTHCPYCALQCGMSLVPKGDLLEVLPRDFPTNQGGLCRKGWSSAELLNHPERLTTPLIRDTKSGPLRPARWDEALDRIASEVHQTQVSHGRNAVAVFGGGGLTNEKAYALGKFARVALRTANIDYNGRFCMSSAAAAGARAFGIDRGLPFPLEDIALAETILLVGGNLAETMPPIMRHFEAQRTRGGHLIVADPRRTPTAAVADLHLQLTPGTDAALANGLLHIAIAEGLIDRGFIETRTVGFEEVRRSVASYWPDRTERITGVPVRDLVKAARMLGEAATGIVLTARGPEQQSRGVDNVLAFINLTLALGLIGRRGCGYGCVTGQGNGQGGREHGQKADQLPGYRKIADPDHRTHVAQVWKVDPDDLPGPGRSAYELLDTLGEEDGARALLVFGSNPVVSSPKANHVEERLRNLDFLAVADIFLSETAALADVVLPTTQWAEEEGTMTNLEGRVILRRQAQTAPGEARSDLQILHELAARFDCESKFPTEPRLVFEELRRASAGGIADYAGISYERIEREGGVFWPCPAEDHPGTPRLFADRFPTEDGHARFHPIEHQGPAEMPDDEYPLYLTTGRLMSQYQSGTQTRRTPSLAASASESFVEIHPSLAKRLCIGEGSMVSVRTRRGIAEARARITATIRQDTLFIPFHFAGRGRANLLTNPALDSTSRMPEFKVCAARLELLETL